MKCNFCEWRCELNNDRTGVCRMYKESGGKIKERFPHSWSTYHIIQMESLPFYHFDPGARCMSIGTASCNFACKYCANAFIAREDPDKTSDSLYKISPEKLVEIAVKQGCTHIVFNVNEPAVSFPSLLELSDKAKSAGIFLGCLTNGYTTVESTELLASVFSFINISLKGLSRDFCRKFLGIPDMKPVLRNIRRLSQISHVELTTPVIDSANDRELTDMASFIENTDREIPWHVFRLLPEHDMKEAEYPDISDINSILEECRKKLPYVYFHNFIGSDWVNTQCPSCGKDVIERLSLGCGGDKLLQNNCLNDCCPECGLRLSVFHGQIEPVSLLAGAA